MTVVQGAELVDVIVDAGESAKSLNRPGMAKLLGMVDGGVVDVVIIAKLDPTTGRKRLVLFLIGSLVPSGAGSGTDKTRWLPRKRRQAVTDDQRGRYAIVRKEYPSGQVFFVFEQLSGTRIDPLERLRIELRPGTKLDDVQRFEEWLNLNIEAVAFSAS